MVKEVDTLASSEEIKELSEHTGTHILVYRHDLIGCATDDVESHWWPHRLPEVLLFSNWTGRYSLLGSWWGNLAGDL